MCISVWQQLCLFNFVKYCFSFQLCYCNGAHKTWNLDTTFTKWPVNHSEMFCETLSRPPFYSSIVFFSRVLLVLVWVFPSTYPRRKWDGWRKCFPADKVRDLPLALCVVHLQLELIYNWGTWFLAYFPGTDPHPTSTIVLNLDFLLHSMPGSLSWETNPSMPFCSCSHL